MAAVRGTFLLAALFLAAVPAGAVASQPFVNLLGAPEPIVQDAQEGGDPRIERVVGAPADLWDRIRRGFAMADLDTRRVKAAEDWYAARPELVQAMLTRARRYLFYVVEEIERRGMPTELALLPLVESGFNPKAVSEAQAVGLWQFIPATGTRYGLEQTEHFDARRDILHSTAAALDYLQFLHGLYNDWHLALAAYNWGEQAVSRALEQSRARGGDGSFASLNLPEETRNYVPKLLAAKNLVADPARFRMELAELPNEPYFSIIKVAAPVSLAAAAGFAGMPVEELTLLNPGWATPNAPGKHDASLVLPVDRAGEFESNYGRWLKTRVSAPARAAKAKRARF